MEQLYKLRNNFALIGLTGRSGSGCSIVADLLSKKNFIDIASKRIELDTKNVNDIKIKICQKYLEYGENWKPFYIIRYSSILLFHLLHQSCLDKSFDDAHKSMDNLICGFKGETPRFSEEDNISAIIQSLLTKTLYNQFSTFTCPTLLDCLEGKESEEVASIFFSYIEPSTLNFFNSLKKYNFGKTKLLLQDLAYSLRAHGTISHSNVSPKIENSYTVAETLNRVIKAFRKSDYNHGRIVIDSLKNSLELTYFKEKYAGFYCIAINRTSDERKLYKREKFEKLFDSNAEAALKINNKIDDSEYKGGEVNKGEFSSPDIENCIQKSDYHIFWSKQYDESIHLGENEQSICLHRQLVKFVALLFQPGIVTPSSQERTMQVAFNAKVNSGCISRQVGAAITDASHSVKAIGWNDVAMYQTPCNLRNLTDLVNKKNLEQFSDFEKGRTSYTDDETFVEKVKSKIDLNNIDNKLKGRSCSFCFKTCHNSFEGEKNQVHTRSLHAEENAMLQITKYGGQGVKGGYLYTTSSPCELCSKKAFQLGIKTIYFIDPYPGIATTHILKSSYAEGRNPTLLMFRGAVGRGFHRLYESFLPYKDELNIRVNLHPKIDDQKILDKLTKDKKKQEKIRKILEEN